MKNKLDKTIFVGKNVIFFQKCDSTNKEAKLYLKKNKTCDGTVFFSDFQTNGQGQRNNHWESEPKKNLIFSVILDTSFLVLDNQFHLSIIISLAIHDYLTLIVDNVYIKWPNDIYVNQKKISGILISNIIKNQSLFKSVIGIGINLNQTKFSYEKAISLSTICGHAFNREVFLEEICKCIENRFLELKNCGIGYMKREYESKMLGYKKKRKFRIKTIVEGIILGVTERGKLVVQTDSQLFNFDVKEVEFL